MYKHILVPTDGSDLSNEAVAKAIQFAKETGAKLTVLHVMPEYIPPAFAEFPAAGQASFAEFMKATEETAKTVLGEARKSADGAGVGCETVSIRHTQPYRAIIDLARDKACDLIFMSSHGRRGLSALVLGSETNKVLTHSSIPVLVFR
ncbi:universal stress protein [Zeimonas arvi]|uniref:Universal stress protein n=1 Tax=Zeimonas arvi TaxID=2498847 RepID=A0A5C8NLK4_9BURK|nr:universal stress protein [Zeimonas arvi]TXL61785.1 universal stress protein [Zeimonas arvi]